MPLTMVFTRASREPVYNNFVALCQKMLNPLLYHIPVSELERQIMVKLSLRWVEHGAAKACLGVEL